MASTSLDFKRARLLASPRRVFPLPLRHISRLLLAFVPRKRWSGLQHGLLSHSWRTHIPLGICPQHNLYATLCALTDLLPMVNFPYPVFRHLPSQGQHDLPSETFPQNRFSSCLVSLERSIVSIKMPPGTICRHVKKRLAGSASPPSAECWGVHLPAPEAVGKLGCTLTSLPTELALAVALVESGFYALAEALPEQGAVQFSAFPDPGPAPTSVAISP